MNPKPLLIAAATLCVSLAAPLHAQTYPQTSADLEEVLQNCDDGSCMDYVIGAIDGTVTYAALAGNPPPFCLAGEIDGAPLRKAILETLEQKPQLRETNPAVAILATFADHWPCRGEDRQALPSIAQGRALSPEQSDAVSALVPKAITDGDVSASEDKRIIVFEDPNCTHCREFHKELDILASRGWMIITLPVATTHERSAGFSAIETALFEIDPNSAHDLRDADFGDAVRDSALAMKFLREHGLDEASVLDRMLQSGAMDTVRVNTQTFFDLGAKGTPSFILGNKIYGGFVEAGAIEAIAKEHEAPSPKGKYSKKTSGKDK